MGTIMARVPGKEWGKKLFNAGMADEDALQATCQRHDVACHGVESSDSDDKNEIVSNCAVQYQDDRAEVATPRIQGQTVC